MIIRIFPFVAVPLAIILAELGVYFMRRKKRVSQFMCWIFSTVLLGASVGWVIMRGDKFADVWINKLMNQF